MSHHMDNKDKQGTKAGAARRVIGDIMIFLTVLFTVYLSVIMIQRINNVVLKDTYRKIFHNELILCAVLILFSTDLRFGFLTGLRHKALKFAGWILRIIVIALSALIIALCAKVVIGGLINTAKDADNVIVLGMALQNGKPTKDLTYRLDTARKYLDKNPSATLILTGGNPDDNGLTEAAVMRDLLTEQGVPEDKMILEDKAQTTSDNFINVARMLDPSAPIILVSSNYHMDRAVQTAADAGFTDCLRLPAPSEPLQYGANVMWEVILDINSMISK